MSTRREQAFCIVDRLDAFIVSIKRLHVTKGEVDARTMFNYLVDTRAMSDAIDAKLVESLIGTEYSRAAHCVDSDGSVIYIATADDTKVIVVTLDGRTREDRVNQFVGGISGINLTLLSKSLKAYFQ